MSDERAKPVPEPSDAGIVLDRAARWRDAGREVALATVVSTWGSSPRPVGSLMAMNDQGGFEGSVSGGCVEASVLHVAGEVMAGAPARVLAFGVSDEQAWEVGLSCGGRIEVFVERLT